MFVPTTWSWAIPREVVTICSDVRVIKQHGTPPPSPMCLQFPVTGAPQRLDGPNGEFILRVKLVG